MARTVAVASQKGGVGKTTTVASLGVALAELGEEVLLVDLDPQACLTFSLGIDPEDLERSVHDVLAGTAAARDVVVGHARTASTCCPPRSSSPRSRRPCSRAAVASTRSTTRWPSFARTTTGSCSTARLRWASSPSTRSPPPTRSSCPLQCETLAHRGVGQLIETVRDVARVTNPRLRISGILPTMYDGRTAHARAVLADIAERYDVPVLEPPIARSVRFAEAPALGRSVLSTMPHLRGAEAYRAHAQRLLDQRGGLG